MRRRAAALARRKALVGVAVVAAAALVVVALLLGGGSGGSPEGAVAAGAGTGTVERRTLAERLTASGTIGYAGEATVVARLAGTVTWLPEVGDVVRRGEPLFEVEGEPVVLMYGTVPAYRDLAEGVSDGEDVLQLEESLAALGFEPGTVDDEFTSSTAAAVTAWQEEIGLEASGEVELGRVAFLPGPRRVTGVEATLGESIGSGGGGTLASGAGKEGTTELVAYEEPSVDPGVESPPVEAEPEPGSPPGADGEAEAPSQEAPEEQAPEPSSTGQEAASPGAAAEAPEAESEAEGSAASVPVLQTSSTRRVVGVELEPDQQAIARRGQRVRVILPDGDEAPGRVQRLEVVEASSEEAPGGSEAEATLEATVALTGEKRVPALDGAAVNVVFTQRVRKDVLSVPLTALLAVGGGRFAVVVEEGGARRRIEVTPGLAADGYVEVEGKGLREGMRVEVGE